MVLLLVGPPLSVQTLSGHLIRRAELAFTTLALAQAAYTLLKGGPLS